MSIQSRRDPGSPHSFLPLDRFLTPGLLPVALMISSVTRVDFFATPLLWRQRLTPPLISCSTSFPLFVPLLPTPDSAPDQLHYLLCSIPPPPPTPGAAPGRHVVQELSKRTCAALYTVKYAVWQFLYSAILSVCLCLPLCSLLCVPLCHSARSGVQPAPC